MTCLVMCQTVALSSLKELCSSELVKAFQVIPFETPSLPITVIVKHYEICDGEDLLAFKNKNED